MTPTVLPAALPPVEGVYVLHFDRPLAHASGYVGWSTDLSRRVPEHLDVHRCANGHVEAHRGSPLVCAAIRAGRRVTVSQIYVGGDRGLERRLHNRHHKRTCVLCRAEPRPAAGPLAA